jgi:hypothetical protein
MVRMSNVGGAAGKAEGQVYSMIFIVDKKNEKDSCHVHELNERIIATATYRDDGDGHGHGHGLDAIDQRRNPPAYCGLSMLSMRRPILGDLFDVGDEG